MLDYIEETGRFKFRDGYNPDIVALRLNLDPVKAVHRPWLFYFRAFLRGPQVTYWYRPGRQATTGEQEMLPIVITHGIGIGMVSYLKFIWHVFHVTRGDAPIYLVELPHVSMRFHGRAPTVPETVRELDAALVEHGHSRAVFVGHSLGSTVVAGMCRHARKRVAAAVLIDPICFLLHLPAVAHGFVRRRPTRANERFIAFFASRELFISRFISRSFHWYHSCMWADDLPPDATVFLSRDDLLVPSAEVGAYLKRHQVQHHMMPLDHAQFMLNAHWETKVVRTIADYAANHSTTSVSSS
ncbi:hypothetical protein SYNPS1DRAFT_17418 [Syncephalis pseudoplumigaleata]|uniref:AB hydrolase-1 domain-containing protein n=1 Tax=Syncephalis pseudoplumigaleata TaxID=1712513 RepID=A0A4P9YWA3_9FUNG|nr:hypothetical protein SYNPS1DRAFT_17418 [Syncephalis pseudoplumigaleata]|eukprot:RKP24297.1 hypothetical protein SYNPS1DRAFT_17418 [Syncephalis pseudoplumigaleata]